MKGVAVTVLAIVLFLCGFGLFTCIRQAVPDAADAVMEHNERRRAKEAKTVSAFSKQYIAVAEKKKQEAKSDKATYAPPHDLKAAAREEYDRLVTYGIPLEVDQAMQKLLTHISYL